MFRRGDSPEDTGGNFIWLSDSTGWTGFQFPGRPSNPKDIRSIWIKARLPEGEWEDPTLRFRAPQQAVEIYLDGKRIYSFGKIDPQNRTATPGSIWHLVSLPEGFQGKEVFFRLYSPLPSYAGYLIEIEAGTKSDHILNILRQSGPSLIFGCIFIFVGLIMILYLITNSADRLAVFHLGISTICLGLWNIAEGKPLQVFIDAPVAFVYIANISIFIMPIGFIVFLRQIFAEKGSIESLLLRRLWQGIAVLTIAAFSCDLAGLASVLQFDMPLHIMLVAIIGACVFTIIKSARSGNRDAYILAAGLFALSVTGLYDTYIMFYDHAQNLNPVRISYLGMLAFLVSLIVIIMMRFSKAYSSLMMDSLENEANYKSLFTNMEDGFAFCREICGQNSLQDFEILETNTAFTGLFGLAREQIIGRRLLTVLPELCCGEAISETAVDETAAAAENSLQNRNMQLGGKWFRVSSFTPKEGYRSIIFTDITEMKTAEEIITHQAYTDSMTGFFNRTYFEDVMAKMSRMLPELKPLSFVAIDIDGLKITNDTFGHKVGDDLLKEAAKIILEVFGSIGIVTRVGGDEFCIILPNMESKIINEKREEIVRGIDAANKAGKTVPISMSIGVATSEETDNEDIYNIYRRADDDMYQYKLSQSGSEKSKVIDMLLTALSERDYVSQGHVERLAEMGEAMAETIGLSDAERRNLILLCKVHDMGKIGIPDEILNKPGKLTHREYERMKQHVRIGYNIANRSKELIHIAPLILHHHERWDGSGYPDGLNTHQIPLECRILGIIDAYDAMTNDRPYHKGIDKRDAILEIEKYSGAQFDPELAASFIELAEKLPL